MNNSRKATIKKPLQLVISTAKQSDFDFLKDPITLELIYGVYAMCRLNIREVAKQLGCSPTSIARYGHSAVANYPIFFQIVVSGLRNKIENTTETLKRLSAEMPDTLTLQGFEVVSFTPKKFSHTNQYISAFDRLEGVKMFPGYTQSCGVRLADYRNAYGAGDVKSKAFEVARGKAFDLITAVLRVAEYDSKILERLLSVDISTLIKPRDAGSRRQFVNPEHQPCENFNFIDEPMSYKYFTNAVSFLDHSVRSLFYSVYSAHCNQESIINSLYLRGVLDMRYALPLLIKTLQHRINELRKHQAVKHLEKGASLAQIRESLSAADVSLKVFCVTAGIADRLHERKFMMYEAAPHLLCDAVYSKMVVTANQLIDVAQQKKADKMAVLIKIKSNFELFIVQNPTQKKTK